MDRQIIVDCQTKNEVVHCEDCVAYRSCKTRGSGKEVSKISVVDLKDVGVWQTWKKRKPLTP